LPEAALQGFKYRHARFDRLSWGLSVARILVLDEDPLSLAIMCRSLEKAQHEVVTPGENDGAIEAFDATTCDAIVCALALPNPDGLEFIRTARHQRPTLAIVVVAGGKAQLRNFNADLVRMIQAVGADDVVKRPFEVHDLIATVERAIAMRAYDAPASAAS
jgi:DNA-binding response OmpR family regulator